MNSSSVDATSISKPNGQKTSTESSNEDHSSDNLGVPNNKDPLNNSNSSGKNMSINSIINENSPSQKPPTMIKRIKAHVKPPNAATAIIPKSQPVKPQPNSNKQSTKPISRPNSRSTSKPNSRPTSKSESRPASRPNSRSNVKITKPIPKSTTEKRITRANTHTSKSKPKPKSHPNDYEDSSKTIELPYINPMEIDRLRAHDPESESEPSSDEEAISSNSLRNSIEVNLFKNLKKLQSINDPEYFINKSYNPFSLRQNEIPLIISAIKRNDHEFIKEFFNKLEEGSTKYKYDVRL